MKAKDIVVGGKYTAKVSGKLTTVRVDEIREVDRQCMSGGLRSLAGKTEGRYDVTNLTTGRKTTFRSAAKFRHVAGNPSGVFEGRLKHPAKGQAGCEFCCPVEGDPFTNRPRGEAWACPYCHTAYTGKETE